MSAVLLVEAIHKQFHDVQALAGASLDVQSGDCVGLLGPNGAGKSTLARAVVGRVRLDAGRITVYGEDVETGKSATVHRNVSLIPQEIALYPTLSATENLRLFGELNGVKGPELDQRIEWALQWTALTERASEPVEQFSGGMKRRLNLACGVLHHPSIVLLDEPTVGVDPQSRAHIWSMLQALRENGAALLLTTHQLDEAEQQCNRIFIIDEGRTIASGTLAELIAQTIGEHRSLEVYLTPESSRHLSGAGLEADEDGAIRTRLEDPAHDIPRVLDAVLSTGAQIADVNLRSPTLQNVFLHLTGRELRDD